MIRDDDTLRKVREMYVALLCDDENEVLMETLKKAAEAVHFPLIALSSSSDPTLRFRAGPVTILSIPFFCIFGAGWCVPR